MRKSIIGLAFLVLTAGAASAADFIEYREIGGDLYVVATDTNGQMLGISNEPLDVSADAKRALASRFFDTDSHGIGTSVSADSTTVDTSSEQWETNTHIVIRVTTKIYYNGVLIKVDTKVIRSPKSELPK